jgi:hypothetical protein
VLLRGVVCNYRIAPWYNRIDSMRNLNDLLQCVRLLGSFLHVCRIKLYTRMQLYLYTRLVFYSQRLFLRDLPQLQRWMHLRTHVYADGCPITRAKHSSVPAWYLTTRPLWNHWLALPLRMWFCLSSGHSVCSLSAQCGETTLLDMESNRYVMCFPLLLDLSVG